MFTGSAKIKQTSHPGRTGTTVPSKKRKAEVALQKFYAVRHGHQPGIYLKWVDCQKQISGFKGALFKSFTTREDAAAFVAGKTPPSEAGAVKGKPDKFYAVAKGNKPGIYTDWETAQLAIVGTKGPKYKRFDTRREAEAFVRLYGTAETVLAMDGIGPSDDEQDEDKDDSTGVEACEASPRKKARLQTNAAAAQPSSSAAASQTGKLLRIYTDGSSRGNGYQGAVAGIGVFFGAGDPRNISERLQGEPQTNQRAELTAILRALQAVPSRQSVNIVTDSKYAIQCVTEWYRNWERNGWQSNGGPVKNRDLVEAVRARIDDRDTHGAQTLFTWVKGHALDPGNVAADRLAVQGALGG
ncbi:hypothetical protein VTK73DRAFT_4652 [Phialemonium thermophilum]|uniref:Ribonuclease H n=1 Tax=Phialemonium thermophilum TaxID=223376 RepID=A0ABR3WSD9_9PEZI